MRIRRVSRTNGFFIRCGMTATLSLRSVPSVGVFSDVRKRVSRGTSECSVGVGICTLAQVESDRRAWQIEGFA
jgi:hypothetical protein